MSANLGFDLLLLPVTALKGRENSILHWTLVLHELGSGGIRSLQRCFLPGKRQSGFIASILQMNNVRSDVLVIGPFLAGLFHRLAVPFHIGHASRDKLLFAESIYLFGAPHKCRFNQVPEKDS